MSLSGNLRTMDLAELLQWIAIGKKTGALTFVRGKTKNTIYFRDGLIVSSRSNEPTYQLGQYLLFQGRITEGQLKHAIEVQNQQRVLLSKVIVEAGLVHQDDVEKAMKSRTEEVIYDLFLWEEGQFYFAVNGNSPEDLFLIRIDVNSVIFEGVRRKDEWTRIRSVFPSNNVILSLRPGADLKSFSLTPLQKKLLFLVNTGRTISEIILEIHGSDFQVNFELFELYEKNVLEVKEIRDAPKRDARTENGFARGMELIEAGKYQEAIATFQKILQADPQNFKAHEQIEAAEKAICREIYSTQMPSTKIPYFLVPVTSLARYRLSHQEGYLASRINGAWDIKSIVALSPLRELEALRILEGLIAKNLIALK